LPNPSPHRYLSHVGAFPSWGTFVLVLLFACGLAEWHFTGRTENTRSIFFVLAPAAVGTGILTAARQGRFDLLLGSGVSRRQIFEVALLRAVALPVAAAAILNALDSSGGSAAHAGSLAIRGGATAVFTLGLAFAVGLVEPRYLVGVSWIAVRVGFLLSPLGFRSLALLRVPGEGERSLPLWQKIVTVAAFPEILLDATSLSSVVFAVIAAALGVVALVVSLRIFEQSDFSGRRVE
jgi:hypothetical protein